MTHTASAFLTYISSFLRSRHDLGLEILALRQQIAMLKRQRPRPHLKRRDRLFWVALSSLCDGWSDAIVVVKPETVVGWRQPGFRLYWRFRSRASHTGRRRISIEIRAATDVMTKENPSWGAPRIHGELVKLGFDISERSVSRYVARRKPSPDDARRKWLTFPGNHCEVLAAMDFFSVSTSTFRWL